MDVDRLPRLQLDRFHGTGETFTSRDYRAKTPHPSMAPKRRASTPLRPACAGTSPRRVGAAESERQREDTGHTAARCALLRAHTMMC